MNTAPSGALPAAIARAAVENAASELAMASAEAVRSLAGDLVESIASLAALDAPLAAAPPDRAQRIMALLAQRLPGAPPGTGESTEAVVRRCVKDALGPAIEQVLSASVASALNQLQTKLVASLRAADPALLSTPWVGPPLPGAPAGMGGQQQQQQQQQHGGQVQGQQGGVGGGAGQARWDVPASAAMGGAWFGQQQAPQQPLGPAFGGMTQAGMSDQLGGGGLLAAGQFGQQLHAAGFGPGGGNAAAANNALLLSQAGLGGQLLGGQLFNPIGTMFGQQQTLQQFMQQPMATLQPQPPPPPPPPQHAPGSLGSIASAYLPAGTAASAAAFGGGGLQLMGASGGGGGDAAGLLRGARRRSRSRSRERGASGAKGGSGATTRPAGRMYDVIDAWRADAEWTWAGAVLRYVEKHDLPPPGGPGSPSDREARDAWALVALARLVVFIGMYEHSRKVARSSGRAPYVPPRVPPRPASIEEARHVVSTLLASDHILAFVLWLSCLADMEASHRLTLEERGVQERAMDAETRHHRESVRVEGLHTLRRRTQYETFIVSTRLTEKMFEQEGIIVMKGMYLACEGMQLGVDGKATTVKIPGAVATVRYPRGGGGGGGRKGHFVAPCSRARSAHAAWLV